MDVQFLSWEVKSISRKNKIQPYSEVGFFILIQNHQLSSYKNIINFSQNRLTNSIILYICVLILHSLEKNFILFTDFQFYPGAMEHFQCRKRRID